MARQLSDTLDAQTNISRVVISASDYRNITWEVLDTHDIDVFVAVLDEVDKLDEDEFLRSLIPAKESGKSDAHIGTICVSTKIEYRYRLNERLDSSLQDNELVFDPYDTDQIRAILENRTGASVNDALEQGVISKVSALAVQEHDDAHKVVDTLYEAGRIAEKGEVSTITEEHVASAVQQAEINRFTQLVSGTTPRTETCVGSPSSAS